MIKVKSISEYLDKVSDLPKNVFYRGENIDYGETACVAKAIRDSANYDSYSEKIDLFDRMIRENNLLERKDLIIPFAQHSGLSTKLLDVTSNPLVALYFACQPPNQCSDGYIYVFDDYADVTSVLEKYPKFDLETEILRHLRMLKDQTRNNFGETLSNQDYVNDYGSIAHDELELFSECVEQYRNKFILGGYSKHSLGRGISNPDSLFLEKFVKLKSYLNGIKSWMLTISSEGEGMRCELLPKGYTEKTPAIDFIHPYQEKRYDYYNQQYKRFDIEVKEYMISLECIVAFINDISPVGNLAGVAQIKDLIMDFLPNQLYRPILPFKRGLNQQSAFFLQTVFDKHELIITGIEEPSDYNQMIPRQLLKCKANHTKIMIVDGASKERILLELDKIGINKATMFGDSDSIAEYI